MAQSLSRVYLHIVFSTKNRTPWLVDAEARRRVHARLALLCGGSKSPALQVGGVADHVHILCALARTVSISELVKEIKRKSSKWVKSQSRELVDFAWQDGYGAFSVSPAHLPGLERYIAEQEVHHRQESFQDEYRRLLSKYGVEAEEEYLWG